MAAENESGMRGRRSLFPSVSVNTLKIASAILLTLYFFSAAVIQNGILHVNSYTPTQLNELLGGDPQAMLWAGIASVAEIVGMIAIPIYAYLLVQGVEHTSSIGKYALSVLIFAIISEVPYDLAVYGQVWSWETQNPLWAVFIALVSLCLMKYVEGRGAASYALGAVAALGGCLWTTLINCKFGWGFVFIAAVLFLLRKWRTISLIAGVGASLVYITAAMGFILISICNGERREDESWVSKYAYYAYYPIVLLLMALWVKMQ
ncbi:MAG: conjugal transfer protein TraX [Oscillospiraceae bacterium]|nr:conjugal transfer protein TraX [Oscillospiraceae bacterium]MDE7170539.1 conjugal transfer protein TraX [Oscillospiraceae bacterium]